MGEYRKAEIIKYTRKAAGMTQEELAEGICQMLRNVPGYIHSLYPF